MDALLKAAEVAALLRVRLSTLYQLCRTGKIPHLRINEGARRALIRFEKSAIEDWLRERRQGVGVDHE